MEKEIKVKNWGIKFNKSQKEAIKSGAISGILTYEGKTIPRWGGGTLFIIDKWGVRYDCPEVVPAYVKDKLDSLWERLFM